MFIAYLSINLTIDITYLYLSMSENMKITNKVVIIITGSTRGFGRALIEEYADSGVHIYRAITNDDLNGKFIISDRLK